MKTVSSQLSTYLNTNKNMISCDLFVLKLNNGTEYYFTNADKDIEFDEKLFRHDKMLIERQQVKLHDTVVVDTMSVNIYADTSAVLGGASIKAAAHGGLLDRAYMSILRAFFDSEHKLLDAMGIFGGIVEVNKCGGLALELTVKAQTQGLSQEFPRRKYYPQGAYTTTNGVVSSTGTNTDGCLIAPFVPLKEVLL